MKEQIPPPVLGDWIQQIKTSCCHFSGLMVLPLTLWLSGTGAGSVASAIGEPVTWGIGGCGSCLVLGQTSLSLNCGWAGLESQYRATFRRASVNSVDGRSIKRNVVGCITTVFRRQVIQGTGLSLRSRVGLQLGSWLFEELWLCWKSAGLLPGVLVGMVFTRWVSEQAWLPLDHESVRLQPGHSWYHLFFFFKKKHLSVNLTLQKNAWCWHLCWLT